MTPVQATAIPPILSCKDVCVEAETGSGKTLSFLVPIAQLILFGRNSSKHHTVSDAPSTKKVRAIVLLPTRELAVQVHSVALKLFEGLPGAVVPVPLIGGAVATSGGAGPDEQYASDHRVIIATPGRLSAAVCHSAIDCAELDVLIMDEADRLLDMGFAVTVTDILTRLPKQRRTGMYSATQTTEVEALARAGMRNPVRVVVRVRGNAEGQLSEPSANRRLRIPSSVRCLFDVVSPRDKLANLMQLLALNPRAKVIVFFLTCACVEYFRRLPLESILSHVMSDMGVTQPNDDDESAEVDKFPTRKFFSLHGKMNQKRRERGLSTFAASDGGILLCTDVAARGIDIADVDWIVQFDIPQDPDAYIHRVGRTGRLGRDGHAVVFINDWEESYIDFLRVRKCDVVELADDMKGVNTRDKVRCSVQRLIKDATLKDRAVLEASEKAFLSFVRAYKEHKCSYLLKISDVDINSVGDSFGLLRLPRFYEFSKMRTKIEGRNKDGVSIRDIGFKDKKRERKRQEDIQEAIANRSQRREALQAKRKKKKKRKRKGNDSSVDANKNDGAGADDDEEEDFSMEAMQLRKLKRGKLSVEQFDQAAGYVPM